MSPSSVKEAMFGYTDEIISNIRALLEDRDSDYQGDTRPLEAAIEAAEYLNELISNADIE